MIEKCSGPIASSLLQENVILVTFHEFANVPRVDMPSSYKDLKSGKRPPCIVDVLGSRDRERHCLLPDYFEEIHVQLQTEPQLIYSQ
jgi:hypothetical protein